MIKTIDTSQITEEMFKAFRLGDDLSGKIFNLLEAAPEVKTRPIGTLFLGGIEGNEYGEIDVDLKSKALEALQEELVSSENPVVLEVYAHPPAVSEGWIRAIDEALVCHHIDVANADDSYAIAKDKLNKMLCVVQDIGAYFAKQESAQSELLEVVIAMRDWIDAVPHDLQLPTMPGFDRDWADAVIADAQKGKQAQSVAESVSKEWDSLGSIGNRLHNISVEQHYAGNEKLSDELGEFASLLWIWDRTRKPTVPPAIVEQIKAMTVYGLQCADTYRDVVSRDDLLKILEAGNDL